MCRYGGKGRKTGFMLIHTSNDHLLYSSLLIINLICSPIFVDLLVSISVVSTFLTDCAIDPSAWNPVLSMSCLGSREISTCYCFLVASWTVVGKWPKAYCSLFARVHNEFLLCSSCLHSAPDGWLKAPSIE